jgi:glycosyltransferase involved in cell wall biosynthesis
LVFGFVISLFDYDILLVSIRQEWLLFWLPLGMAMRSGIVRKYEHTTKRHILHSLFSNGIGGTERHLAELAAMQVAAGHRVTILLRADRNPYNARDALRDWLPPQATILTAPRRWPVIALAWQLRQLQPDIIHTHHRRDARHLGMAAPLSVPVLATLHLPYRKQDYRRHDGLICVAPWQYHNLPKEIATHSVVIPNWIAPPPPASPAERLALREELGVTETSPQKILGYVGRLTAEKGVEELVSVFAALPAENTENTLLCLFGEGECRPALEACIQASGKASQIRLLGYQADIRRWYAALDGLVLPSREESFGLVLLEAMRARLPILSTRSAGAMDILGTHPQVIWAECNNKASLAQALTTFLPYLGEQWQYPALQEYTPEAAFQKKEDFYAQLMKEKI